MNLATERIISHLNELHDVVKFYLLGQSFFGVYAVISHNKELLYFAVAWSVGHSALGWIISKTSNQFNTLITVIRRAEQADFDSETAAILYSREQAFNEDAKQILSLGSVTDESELLDARSQPMEVASEPNTFKLSKRVEQLEQIEQTELIQLVDFLRSYNGSDSSIIKDVLLCQGNYYQQGKQLLEQIRKVM